MEVYIALRHELHGPGRMRVAAVASDLPALRDAVLRVAHGELVKARALWGGDAPSFEEWVGERRWREGRCEDPWWIETEAARFTAERWPVA